MSRFTGKQYRGAMRGLRATRRAQAEQRNAQAQASLRPCGHVHGAGRECSR